MTDAQPSIRSNKVIARLDLEVRANGCYSVHITGPNGQPVLGQNSYYSPRLEAKILRGLREVWEQHIADMREKGWLDT